MRQVGTQRGQGQENHQHYGGKVAGQNHRQDQQVGRYQHPKHREAGEFFPEQNRQGVNPLFFINLDFVDVFPKDDGRNAEIVGDAGPDDAPVPVPSQNVITAANHQRAPDEQDGHFAKGDVFERPGVKEDEKRAQAEQNPDQGIVAVLENQIQAAGQRGQTGSGEVTEELTGGQQPVGHWLGAVHGAEVVILVHPADEVGVIVEEIVGGVGQHQAESQRQPGEQGEFAIAQGEQSGQGGGDEGHHQHGGAGGNQPFRNKVELFPLCRGDRGDDLERFLPHRKIHTYILLLVRYWDYISLGAG